MNCSELSLYGISPLFDQTILVKCHICQIVVKLPQFTDHLTKRHDINNADQLIPTNSNSLITTTSNSNNNTNSNNNATNNINDNTSSSTSSASTSSSVLSWSLSSSSSSSTKTNNNKSKRKNATNTATRNSASKRKSSSMTASSSDVSQEPLNKTLILENGTTTTSKLPPPLPPVPLIKQSPKASRAKAVKPNDSSVSLKPIPNPTSTNAIVQQPVPKQEINISNGNGHATKLTMSTSTPHHTSPHPLNPATINNNSKNSSFNSEDNEAKLKYVVEKIKSKLGKSLSASNAPPTARQPVLIDPPPPPLLSQSSHVATSVIRQPSCSTTQDISSKPLTPIKPSINPNANLIKKTPKQQKHNDDNFLFEPYDNLIETSNKNYNSQTPPTNVNANRVNQNENENISNKPPKRLHSNAKISLNKPLSKIYDPDKHCGVITEQTDELTGLISLSEPCTRSLTCKKHPINLRRQVPGRSKSFNELFKQYRDEKSSSTTGEQIEINNQSLTNEIFVEQQSENFPRITNETIATASLPPSLINSFSENIIKATKQIPLIRSASTTPNKKEPENDTSNFVDLNFKTTQIMNQINSNHKNESNHLIDAQFNNDTFKYNSSNDFINIKYDTKTKSQNQSIGEVMPNGDIDYRNINQPSFQSSINLNHLNNNTGFNMIPEENINFNYQQINNAHLPTHQNHHNTTYEALNNSNDLVYLSSPPPSNSNNPNKFHQQKQTLLTTSPPPTTPNSMTESYYFDSILSKLNLTNNIVKHHPRPSAVTSFNARLTNNGGGYTLWNRRQDNLRNLLCNAFESSHCSKNRNYGFNQAPLPNNITNATWVTPASSLNSNRAKSNYNEYTATTSQNNKTFNNETTNNFRPKSMNLDSDKNQYSLSSLINKKNNFNISNSNNNHNNHEVSSLINREIQISNTSHQHHYQHQNNNHFTNGTNIQNDFLTNAIKKAAASNLNSNTIVPSANLQSISSSSFSNSSHSWISCPKSNETNEFLHDNNLKNTSSSVNNISNTTNNNPGNQIHMVHSTNKNGILNKNVYPHKLQS